MYLYKATGDPTFMQLGRDAIESIDKISRVNCGFATVSVSVTFQEESQNNIEAKTAQSLNIVMFMLFWSCVVFKKRAGFINLDCFWAVMSIKFKEYFLSYSSPKIEIYWKSTLSQAIQDVDEFVSSCEQIWRDLTLHPLLTNGSSAVNGCRQNESPNSWLKHHTQIQSIK